MFHYRKNLNTKDGNNAGNKEQKSLRHTENNQQMTKVPPYQSVLKSKETLKYDTI